MARILVTGDTSGIAATTMLENLVAHIRGDGHDAALVGAVEDPAQEVRDADAIVAILDSHASLDAATLVAFARAERKPILGVFRRGATPPRFLRSLCTQTADVRRGGEIRDALGKFYDHVKPFAGRLVRDNVPELVRAAGHQVQFREVEAKDLPRFIKRKIAEEAAALDAAAGGQEKEELADLLEALEAFIAARGIDRDELKRIKAHKKEQRGGFTTGYVVESASTSGNTAPAAEDPGDAAGQSPAGAPAARAPPAKQANKPSKAAKGAKPAKVTPHAQDYEGPAWEAEDAVPVQDALQPAAKPTQEPSDDSEARLWEL